MRKIQKPESLRLSRADFILLATPAASLVPNVLAFVFPFGSERRGIRCVGYNLFSINFAQAFALERTIRVHLTLKVSIPGS